MAKFEMKVVSEVPPVAGRGRKSPLLDSVRAFAKANPGKWCLVAQETFKDIKQYRSLTGKWSIAIKRNAGFQCRTRKSSLTTLDVYLMHTPPAKENGKGKTS